MNRSEARILTTHVGSLPRGPELTDLLISQEQGNDIDEEELENLCAAAVEHVVEAQLRSGVDIINDGEQPRVGFQTYVPQRMSGFGGESARALPQDMIEFPGYLELMQSRNMMRAKVSNAPQAIKEVEYRDLSAVTAECDLFRACVRQRSEEDLDYFMTAASPGIIATTMLNAFYDSHEAYVLALAEQMRREYEYIHSQGFLLQLDAPDLAMERTWLFKDQTKVEFNKTLELHVHAINQAIRNIPPERIRLHICWGNYDGPHNHDVPLADLLPVLYEAKVGALSVELANPRHQHEYKVFRTYPLPESMLLIPGVIDSTTSYIEHPEIVADRLCQVIGAVGDRTRVLAGSDCGFGTFAGWEMVPEAVVWAKLAACSEGARLASERLWN